MAEYARLMTEADPDKATVIIMYLTKPINYRAIIIISAANIRDESTENMPDYFAFIESFSSPLSDHIYRQIERRFMKQFEFGANNIRKAAVNALNSLLAEFKKN